MMSLLASGFVVIISLIVFVYILLDSGIVSLWVHALITKYIPWLIFPVSFFFGLFWMTDSLSESHNYFVVIVLSLMAFLGGIMQVLLAIYERHRIHINFTTAHDRFTHVSIVPRVVIFGVLYIVLGGLGLYNPKPLHQVFMDHQAGKSWVAIVNRARSHEVAPDPIPVRSAVRRRTS